MNDKPVNYRRALFIWDIMHRMYILWYLSQSVFLIVIIIYKHVMKIPQGGKQFCKKRHILINLKYYFPRPKTIV